MHAAPDPDRLPSLTAGGLTVAGAVRVADVARTLNETRPLRETLNAICSRVAGLPGCDFVTIRMEERPAGPLREWAAYGMKPEYLEWIEEVGRRDGWSARAPSLEAHGTGQPVTVSDVMTDPRYPVLRAGARLQGYRAVVCVPIVIDARVLGTLNGYAAQPHRHRPREIELLGIVARLAGVAIQTARVAERQQDDLDAVEHAGQQLRAQVGLLTGLNEAQARMAGALADPDREPLAEIASALARFSGRAVLLGDARGRPLAFAGDAPLRAPLEEAVADAARRTRRHAAVETAGGTTRLLVGETGAPVGVIAVHPEVPDRAGHVLAALRHAAALMLARIETQRADRALQLHARPAMLLAAAHGLLGEAQVGETAQVLAAGSDSRLRLAVGRCATDADAQSLARHVSRRHAPSSPVVTAVADQDEVLVLLDDGPPEVARRSLERISTDPPGAGPQGWGLSSPVVGLTQLPTARQQAAIAAGGPGTGVVAFEELGALSGFFGSLDTPAAEALVGELLAPLERYDRDEGRDLLGTLEAYLGHDGSVHRAAQALRVHPNTVQVRIARCAELTGLDLGRLQNRAALLIALQLRRRLTARPAGSRPGPG